MKNYSLTLVVSLLVCFIMYNERETRNINVPLESLHILPEPGELPELDKETMFQVAKLRKENRLRRSANSALANVEEYGPNIAERICLSNVCFSGMIKEFVIDREDSNIFVMATETSGAWVSYNRGRQWEPIDDDWSGIFLIWVSQDLKDPNIFYFSTGSLGLLVWDRSKNDGLQSWNGPIEQTEFASFLKQDPNDPNVHYVGTINNIQKFENNEYSLFAESVFFPNADFEVVPDVGLVSSNVDNVTVIREDGSRSVLNTGFVDKWAAEIAYSPSNPKIMYTWASDAQSNIKMHRTIDGGYNWSPVDLFDDIPRIQRHDQTLEIYKYDDDTDIIIWGAVNLFIAFIDNDHIEQPLFKPVLSGHLDYQGTLFQQDTLYEYTDGGLFAYDIHTVKSLYESSSTVRIRDFGESLSHGLNSVQAVEAIVHPDTEEMSIGLWHNGTWLNDTDGSYTKVSNGDGFQSAFHPTDSNFLYVSFQYNTIIRRYLNESQGVNLWTGFGDKPFRTKLFVHPNYPESLFYLNNDNLVRMSNASTCSQGSCVLDSLSTANWEYAIQDYAFDNSGRTNSAYLFNNDIIEKIPSLDNPEGTTIFDTRELDDYDIILDVFVSSTEEVNIMYVLTVTSGDEYTVHKMLNHEDNTVETLETYNIKFPNNVRPTGLFKDGLTDNQCLFTTFYGLFSSRLVDGVLAIPEIDLPNVEVRNIRYEPKLDKLYFATYGRGVWTASSKEPSLLTANCQDLTVVLDGTGNTSITGTEIDNGSNDDTGIASMTVYPNSFDCSHIGDNIVTLTVTDLDGNVATCTSTVTVDFNISSTNFCQDVIVTLDDFGEVTLTAADLDNGLNDQCVIDVVFSQNTFNCSDIGDNDVNVFLLDLQGNSSICNLTVTVEESILPTALCQNILVQLDDNGSAFIQTADINNGSSDNCGIKSTSIDITAFNCDDLESNVVPVTLTVTDFSNNTAQCTSTVQVLDAIAPNINCPEDLTIQISNDSIYRLPDFIASGEASVSDNCTDSITLRSSSPAVGTILQSGQHTVSLFVEDASGNLSACEFELTIDELTSSYSPVELSNFELYPNPTKDLLFVDNPDRELVQNILVFDLLGRQVLTESVNTDATKIELNLSNLSSSTYMVVIQTKDSKFIKKLTKV